MKNKDLIIKVARRLDKFNLDEIIVVSELQEQEVKAIFADLIKEQVILKVVTNIFLIIKEIMSKMKYYLQKTILLNLLFLKKRKVMRSY